MRPKRERESNALTLFHESDAFLTVLPLRPVGSISSVFVFYFYGGSFYYKYEGATNLCYPIGLAWFGLVWFLY